LKPARLPRILFVCGRNLRRSPTAEALYRDDPRVDVRSAGVGEQSRRRLTRGDLEWADVVLAMEHRYVKRIREAFRDLPKLPRIESLDVPDEYEFMDEELVEILRISIETHIQDPLDF